MLNERLAAHYGLPPIAGVALRRVALPPDSPRGGLMTQASILKVTANGTTTSPVLRGAWIMERILGQPPPPPPPGIPAVEPDIRADPPLIDTRLLKAPGGYILPVANYNAKVGEKVTESLSIDKSITKVVSAYHGALPATREKDRLVFTIPTLGYGDVIRLTEK